MFSWFNIHYLVISKGLIIDPVSIFIDGGPGHKIHVNTESAIGGAFRFISLI